MLRCCLSHTFSPLSACTAILRTPNKPHCESLRNCSWSRPHHHTEEPCLSSTHNITALFPRSFRVCLTRIVASEPARRNPASFSFVVPLTVVDHTSSSPASYMRGDHTSIAFRKITLIDLIDCCARRASAEGAITVARRVLQPVRIVLLGEWHFPFTQPLARPPQSTSHHDKSCTSLTFCLLSSDFLATHITITTNHTTCQRKQRQLEAPPRRLARLTLVVRRRVSPTDSFCLIVASY